MDAANRRDFSLQPATSYYDDPERPQSGMREIVGYDAEDDAETFLPDFLNARPTKLFRLFGSVEDGIAFAQAADSEQGDLVGANAPSVVRCYSTKFSSGTPTTVRKLAELALNHSLDTFDSQVRCMKIEFETPLADIITLQTARFCTSGPGHVEATMWIRDLRASDVTFLATTNGPAKRLLATITLGFGSAQAPLTDFLPWDAE